MLLSASLLAWLVFTLIFVPLGLTLSLAPRLVFLLDLGSLLKRSSSLEVLEIRDCDDDDADRFLLLLLEDIILKKT